MSSEFNRSKIESSFAYQEQIDSVLNRPLTPENIDKYADDALDDLIQVAQSAMSDYSVQPTLNFNDTYSRETAAFNYFHLDNIESILDFVSLKASEIKQLDALIYQATIIANVILPPDSSQALRIGSGNGMKPKELIPRLKTTLFILSNEFDIDPNDPEQITITQGTNRDKMVRDESYYYVEAHGLQRSFLICDEEGNASYVFDTSKLALAGLNLGMLIDLPKSELNALLQAAPDTGQRVVYSNNFSSNMLNAIDEPRTLTQEAQRPEMPARNSERQVVLRVPVGDVPEGFTTINGMRYKFGVTQDTVERAVRKLKATNEIGDDTYYLFERNQSFRGFSPEDQQVVYKWLAESGVYAEVAPETYVSSNAFGEFFNTNYQAIGKAVSALREAGIIGEERTYKFGLRARIGFSPEEQNVVYDWLRDNNYLVPVAPEGQLSITGFGKWLGTTESSILKAVNTLQEAGALAELPQHRFYGNRSQSLSPWDQNIVRDKLISTGILAPPAPEGCLSFLKLASSCKVSPKTLRTVLDALEESGELKPAEYYKFGSRSAPGYTIEQRETVTAYMEQKGITAESPPNGYLSLYGLSNELGISRNAIQNALNEISDEELGAIETYRFDAITTKGYSPAQQQRISECLEKKGLFKLAPKDYVPLSTLSKNTLRDPETVLKAITQLEGTGELGQVVNYSFSGKVLRGFSPDQQEKIAATLLSYGINPIERVESANMPDDYKSVNHLGELTGVAWNKIESIAKSIDAELMGKVQRYKMDNVARKAYSPEQQKLIFAELEARGMFSPEAPENYTTFTQFRDTAKVTHSDLRKVIEGISEDELGPVTRYRFKDNTNPSFAYSPVQQSLILARLADSRAREGWVPEGFESVSALARRLGLGSTNVEKIIQTIEPEKLGPLETYKFKTKWTVGLTPEQQKLVTNRLAEQGILVPTAPEGVLTRNRIAKALRSNLTSVSKAVAELDAEGELGEPRNYKFNKAPRPFRGFLAEDQAKIERWLASHKRTR